MVLITPEGNQLLYSLKFESKVSNNQAEYKALIANLNLGTAMGMKRISIYGDSQLVVN